MCKRFPSTFYVNDALHSPSPSSSPQLPAAESQDITKELIKILFPAATKNRNSLEQNKLVKVLRLKKLPGPECLLQETLKNKEISIHNEVSNF